jgi:dolichyl-phosphate beta-glucosyltransferase
MLRAKGDYVIFMDTDLSTPLVEVLSFLSRFQEDPGIDVLVGNRKNNQSSYTENRSLFRKVLSLGFIKIREYIVGLKQVSDTQCGFKAFRQKASREVFH